MTTQSTRVTTATVGDAFSLQPGYALRFASQGTITGQLKLQVSSNQGASWETAYVPAVDVGDIAEYVVVNESQSEERYRFSTIGGTGISLLFVIADYREPVWGAGTAGSFVVDVVEESAAIHKTTVTFARDFQLAVLDAGQVSYVDLYQFPAPATILIHGVHGELQFGVASDRATTIQVDNDMHFAIGTSPITELEIDGSFPSSGRNLAASRGYLLPVGSQLNEIDSGVESTAALQFAYQSNLHAYLNVSVDDEMAGDGIIKIAGHVTFTWSNLK